MIFICELLFWAAVLAVPCAAYFFDRVATLRSREQRRVELERLQDLMRESLEEARQRRRG